MSRQLHAPSAVPPPTLSARSGFLEDKKPLAPAGIRTADRPARSLIPIVTELPRLCSALSMTCAAVLYGRQPAVRFLCYGKAEGEAVTRGSAVGHKIDHYQLLLRSVMLSSKFRSDENTPRAPPMTHDTKFLFFFLIIFY